MRLIRDHNIMGKPGSIFKFLFLLGIALFIKGQLRAQSLPVNSANETYLRNLQLAGELDPAVSFGVRPLSLRNANLAGALPDSSSPRPLVHGKNLNLKLLPVTIRKQYNALHPFGWNDGPMIPARGYQALSSAGLYFNTGPLSIQLLPEFVYASNLDFEGFAPGKTDLELAQYYGFYNSIDAPDRFGTGKYTKVFWGQSSIKLNFGAISFGLSNENMWWGPGVQNSLLMTNNAPGFKHIIFNTNRPIRTGIGSFEGQILGGRLDGSGFTPLSKTATSTGTNLFRPYKDDWRYISGLNVNYQPKWIPGLFFGFIRTFIAYHDNLKGFSGYFPFFVKLQKQTGDPDEFARDQRISLYSRWLFQKAKAEVYFEYGLNDNAFNLRDFFGSPDHGRAYIAGFTKLLPITRRKDQYLKINLEINQLAQSIDRSVRQAGSFYEHGGVHQGYTHLGQVIGAGSGTGGNLQTFQLSWLNGFKSIGIAFERLENNMDLYDRNIGDLNGFSRKWVDFALAFKGQWDYKNFIFNAKVQGIQSLNYQWFLQNYDPSKYYIPNYDVFNFHGELGVTYRF